MIALKGKKILLGVSGSIAAYKTAFLIRLLVKAGAEVQVLMTRAATKFITPLTLSTLSKRPVLIEVTSEESWNNHVELGLWADAMLVAPMTANTLAKLANGHCDSMIAAAYLSARCPVFFAPAMDLDMWQHPSTQANVNRLQSYGDKLIPVEHGELASGLVGKGRMAEPENIVAFLSDFFQKGTQLEDKEIMITAGPTFEAIDPVRFIGNRSSGRMGIALADEIANRGGKVKLILGPSSLKPTAEGVDLIPVQSAEEMYQAALEYYPEMDLGILAAAVSDYRPKEVFDKKIKKNNDELHIELVKNPDIAASLGKTKKKNQYLVGFALETNDEEANAKAKLEKKNFRFYCIELTEGQGGRF